MKRNLVPNLILAVLLVSACSTTSDNEDKKIQQNTASAAVSAKSIEYDVITRVENEPAPAGFQPQTAGFNTGDYNENVSTTANRVLNEESHMLKKVTVAPVGVDELDSWQLLCDEGGAEHEQFALNPLSYMVGGISSSLLTRTEEAIEILGLDVDDARVEVKVSFRYEDPFTPNWTGFTDTVVASIIIESDEPAEKIAKVREMAVKAWAVGECLINETPVDAQYGYNDAIWDVEYAKPGFVSGPDSYDNDLKLSSNGHDLDPITFEVGPDVPMNFDVKTFKFDVIGLAESEHDAQRPHLHSMRVRSINGGYAAWKIYADDSRGYEGTDKAPTSNDYFTAGTTLCLMSQLTGSQMIHQKQGINISDFRAEHQFNFEVDNYKTAESEGHVDGVITRILVKGDATEKQMSNFASLALRMCFAGEAVLNSTDTQIGVYLNGNNIK